MLLHQSCQSIELSCSNKVIMSDDLDFRGLTKLKLIGHSRLPPSHVSPRCFLLQEHGDVVDDYQKGPRANGQP